jgi:hypothetical protein
MHRWLLPFFPYAPKKPKKQTPPRTHSKTLPSALPTSFNPHLKKIKRGDCGDSMNAVRNVSKTA